MIASENRNRPYDSATPYRYRGLVLALVLLCVALVVNEVFGAKGIIALRGQKREFDALQQQIRKLQQDNQELQISNRKLQGDPATIEKTAREQLHMARPNELIYTLPPKSEPSGTTTAAPSNRPPASDSQQ
ncbi:MAG TPA: septum formation initiator family protein [Terriglobia bacterium]|nr:septum formation initiator family protein [Terriglobia bacterium]